MNIFLRSTFLITGLFYYTELVLLSKYQLPIEQKLKYSRLRTVTVTRVDGTI